MYLISACLVGINCRYDATSTLNFKLKDMIGEGKVIAVAVPDKEISSLIICVLLS